MKIILVVEGSTWVAMATDEGTIEYAANGDTVDKALYTLCRGLCRVMEQQKDNIRELKEENELLQRLVDAPEGAGSK